MDTTATVEFKPNSETRPLENGYGGIGYGIQARPQGYVDRVYCFADLIWAGNVVKTVSLGGMPSGPEPGVVTCVTKAIPGWFSANPTHVVGGFVYTINISAGNITRTPL